MKELRQTVEQLKTQVAVDQAGAEVLELTSAIKGRKFEETVFEATAMRELENAIANRAAKAGVLLVFSAQAKAPIGAPLRIFGNKAIVVLDKDEPDARGLQLALANARCVLQRQLNGAGKTTELETILALVEDGQRQLACHAAIKRCHTAAQNQITSAARQVRTLIEGLDEILDEGRSEANALAGKRHPECSLLTPRCPADPAVGCQNAGLTTPGRRGAGSRRCDRRQPRCRTFRGRALPIPVLGSRSCSTSPWRDPTSGRPRRDSLARAGCGPARGRCRQRLGREWEGRRTGET